MWEQTDGFLDSAEFLEFRTKSAIIGVPCKATMVW